MATAKKAKGTVRLQGEPDTKVPRGTELVREDDARFATSKKATIGEDGTAEVTVAAVRAGQEGVTPAGVNLQVLEPIDGLLVEEDEQYGEVVGEGLIQDADQAPTKDEVADEGTAVLVNYVVGGPRYLTGQKGQIQEIDDDGVATVEVWRPGAKPIVLKGVRPRGDGPPFPGPTWESAPEDPPEDG